MPAKAKIAKRRGGAVPKAKKGQFSLVPKGSLTKYGYSSTLPIAVRRKALEKAVSAYGANDVVEKLRAVALLQSKRSPATAHKFADDAAWVMQNYVN